MLRGAGTERLQEKADELVVRQDQGHVRARLVADREGLSACGLEHG